MREERGQLSGDVVVYEEFTLWGSVGGNVKVIKGGKFYLRGIIYGNLVIEAGGRTHIFGSVTGNLTLHPDTKVILSGIVGGDVLNMGGRLFVERAAQLQGKLKTKAGQTEDQRGKK
jgi:cytoskeletal protein CcmA (bactofilin family)